MSNAGKQPYRCTIKSSTGYVAIKNNSGKTGVYSAVGDIINIHAAKEIVIWPCEKDDPKVAGEIQTLDCSHNQLCKLDVTGLSSLQSLNCSNNNLKYLWLFGPVGSFFDGPRNLQSLDCSHNSIVELDLSELCHVRSVDCAHNQLRSLRLGKKLKNLISLDCSDNRLPVVDLAGLAVLQMLNASDNKMNDPTPEAY